MQTITPDVNGKFNFVQAAYDDNNDEIDVIEVALLSVDGVPTTPASRNPNWLTTYLTTDLVQDLPDGRSRLDFSWSLPQDLLAAGSTYVIELTVRDKKNGLYRADPIVGTFNLSVGAPV